MRRHPLLIAIVALLFAAPGAAHAADVNDPAVIREVKAAQATTPPGATERFKDGLYDAQSAQIYVDGNPDAVWLLRGNKLVAAPVYNEIRPAEPCGYVTYFHCESLKVTPGCQPTTFYLGYYNNGEDKFDTPYGSLLNPPEQVSIRDDDGHGYRRYGPRGVRAYHEGKYGFYSINCLQ